MKNHIVIKFIAVLLCALSLLGAVGSAAGILVLTEMDLYNKSAEQVYGEKLKDAGQAFAYDKAMVYASGNLGGCPEAMLRSYSHADGYAFQDALYGYRLLDAEGNVLESKDLPAGTSFSAYTFPIAGQYMHLVDSVTATEQAMQIASRYETPGAEPLIEDHIPDGGALVADIQLSLVDSSYGVSGDELGIVYRNQDGTVVLFCESWFAEIGEREQIVTALTLRDENGVLLYDAAWYAGIGSVRMIPGSGQLVFTSFKVETPVAAAETEPATEPATEATLPETEPTEVTEAATEATEAAEEKTGEQSEKKETSEEKTEKSEKKETSEEKTGKSEKKEGSEEKAEAAEATVPETTEAATEPVAEETVPEETVPAETVPEPVMINGKPLNTYQINRTEYYDPAVGDQVVARYVYLPLPQLQLELYAAPGALQNAAVYGVLQVLRAVRIWLLPVLGICLLLFGICVVYLCCAAGRKPKTDEVRAGGLNRIPLDLYGFCVLGGVTGLCLAIAEGGYYLLEQNVMVGCAFGAGMGLMACLLIVGFLFAFVAQIKTPGGFWWRNSLVGLSLKLCQRLLKKLWQLCGVLRQKFIDKGIPLLKRMLLWIFGLIAATWQWLFSTLKKIFLWIHGQINRFLSLLPVTWQWLLVGGVMILLVFAATAKRLDAAIVAAVLFAIMMVLYGAHCFGILVETARKMNKGNLDIKVDDKLMVGAFKEFAGDLNDLAGVAMVAAQKQLKSERMKTELITNVSHDIKTPLTSIINYVDLLRKSNSEEEQEQYLEVLDRQSQRLKKLIDDLMDMSKASTGNMAVEITRLDAVEAVNQALGEFGDKLDRARLTPVFRHTEGSVPMMADGRLVWRVLSNLLSNTVKYAMPGTRVHIDLMQLDGEVVISLKNISRDELNVDAEELMERFVRGDDSRNTEGSGLGLNIAKSLMELQKGQLQLLVDGDLFKVTLIFPGM